METRREALVVFGGWDGHEPDRVADLFKTILTEEGFAVTVSDSLDAFADESLVNRQSLLVPMWTMGEISVAQLGPVLKAVEAGTGLAGCHGGMCDSFRNSTDWQFMTGSQWVAHPGNDGVTYPIEFVASQKSHPIIQGMANFSVTSEQYYMHVDPGVTVLATTPFPTDGVTGPHAANPCDMPQIYVKRYGQGRVFYSAIGHGRSILEQETPRELMRRGFLWAAKRS